MSKWHPTTKGTLRRNYRVPSKSEGRRLLKSIATLLSDDDHFIDATSHKVFTIKDYICSFLFLLFTFVETSMRQSISSMVCRRVVKLEGRALMERVSVATTSGLCSMSSQHRTLLWKLLLFLLGLLQIRIIPKLRN